MVKLIDLRAYRSQPRTRVYTGTDEANQLGTDIFKALGSHQFIEVIAPDDCMSINPHFLELALKPAFYLIGQEGIERRVFFTVKGLYGDGFELDLEEAFQRLERERLAS